MCQLENVFGAASREKMEKEVLERERDKQIHSYACENKPLSLFCVAYLMYIWRYIIICKRGGEKRLPSLHCSGSSSTSPNQTVSLHLEAKQTHMWTIRNFLHIRSRSLLFKIKKRSVQQNRTDGMHKRTLKIRIIATIKIAVKVHKGI